MKQAPRKTSSQSLTQKVLFLIKQFRKHYPEARCELNFRNLYELTVATVLSAQTTDALVNRVTPALFQAFPDFSALARASWKQVDSYIRCVNYHVTKAKRLVELAQQVVVKHQGQLPTDLESLTQLPGIGRKTANVILGVGLNQAKGIVVDTHVARISRRLGLTQNRNPQKIEEDLKKLIPRPYWIVWSHWLIAHGRRICRARNPSCSECFIANECQQPDSR